MQRTKLNPWRVASASGMSLLLLVGQTAPLLGNPTGGAVVAGGATIGAACATLTVNQSTQNAIINWQTFSIASGETTKFIVPNSGAETLNRVAAGNPSQIYGNLQSNGILYLVNPSGIVVGPNGRIDTAGFMASTLDVSNEQFLAGGNLEFAGTSDAAINNAGTIHASTGDVYLIANQVNNTGKISAPKGNVGLAAGSDVLFQQAGSQHLFVQATPAGTTRATGVTNAGTIRAAAAELKAAGGNAYALAINNTGVIAATGYKKINGQVYLTSDGGSISNSGKISAKQKNGNGGTIALTGTSSTSTSSANTVTNSGTLDASATKAGGTGGTISVKNMTGATVHSGAIIAKGGQGGTGGTAEVSGYTVGFSGTVDLTAPGGTTGNLLLDPATLTVISGGLGTISGGQNDPTSTSIDPLVVGSALLTANITLNADTNITVSDPITWTSANSLTLSTNTAGSTIDINAGISGVNGSLIFDTKGITDLIGTGSAGTINVKSFALQSGDWNQLSGSLPAFTASSDFELTGSTIFLRATGGSGTTGTPYQITDVYGLQGLESISLLGSSAVLMNNVNATATTTWNSNFGFTPIGSNSTAYSGTFNGQGFTIDGLALNQGNFGEIGMFGVVSALGGTIENVNLTNAHVSGFSDVGALVGVNSGTVTGSSSTGTITGPSSVGGLVGTNGGTITKSYSTATIMGLSGGNGSLGGLVGDNGGTISASYSGGAVSGVNVPASVGGLAGTSGGTISNSYSYSAVTGGSADLVGGLVGDNFGPVTDSYSSGTVTSTGTDVGGFIGENETQNGGVITASFWDNATSGQPTTGIGNGAGGGLTGDPTSNLISITPYSTEGWSIGTDLTADTWVIISGSTRPMLAMEYSGTINNAHQLQLVGLNATTISSNYSLAQSIDASGTTNASDVWGTSTGSGKGFVPIASGGSNFTGTFNGQGHTIAYLYINNTSIGTVGLFGETVGATISNTGLAVANITGNDYTGALVGITDDSTVVDCYTTGTVTGGGTGFGTGGLVGFNTGGSISQSFSTATVNGAAPTGGLVGTNEGIIMNCFTAGSVSGTLEVGGLVGENASGGSIIDSYSTSAIGGTATSRGGLVGTIAGGTVSNSYWDTDTAGVTQGDGTNATQAGITGDTTVQLEDSAFAPPTWNFTTVWSHVAGNTPQLLDLPQAPAPTGSPSFDTLSGTAFLDSGVTAAGASLTIDALSGGIVIGTATTTSSGGFTFSLTSAQLTGGVLLTDATDSGNTYYQANTPLSSITGIDLWGSTVRTLGDTASNTALSTAVGSLSGVGVQYSVNGAALATNTSINFNIGSTYTLDGDISARTITVGAPATASLAGGLSLSARNDVVISARLTNTTGGVTLLADNGGTGVGTVTFTNGAQVSSDGPVLIFYNPSVNPAGSSVNNTSYVSPTEDYSADVTGNPVVLAYMLVNTLNDLQNVKNNLSGTYALSHNIDASATASWNSGLGFVPIGSDFNGTFNGQGFAIDSLTINTPSSDFIGLFSSIATTGVIENVGLTNAHVSGTTFVGALVGALDGGGTVSDSYSTGTVTGSGDFIGGLIGDNNQGTVSEVYSTATVNAPTGLDVGGLIGANVGTITDAYATGAVTGATSVGGFIGEDTSGTIHNAYSTGLVTGTGAVGGFIGTKDAGGGGVTNSFWDTDSSGQSVGIGSGTVAGLVGATTAQLETQSFITANATASPAFDFTNVWSTDGNTLTPQLTDLPQTALPSGGGGGGDSLDGTAYLNSGVTAAGAGLTIDVLFNGSLLGSTTTDSSGDFTFNNLTNAELNSGILLTDVTDKGNTYFQADNPGMTNSGITIWGSTLRTLGGEASTAALGLAAGSATGAGINYTVTGNSLITNPGINLNIGSHYAFGGVIAANNIAVNDQITSTTSGLTVFGASGSITISANVTDTAGGAIELQADNTGTGVGRVIFNAGAKVSTSGAVTIFYNPSVNPAGSAVNTTSYVNPTENYAPDVAGGGTLTAYMLVNTLNDLQNVQNNPAGTYALSHNIDATATAGWNGGAGFVAIGNDTTNFTGTFNGQDFVINGLTINRPSTPFVGLFGETGSGAQITSVGLTNEQVTGDYQVGGLVGLNNFGNLTLDYVDGSINATGFAVGGGTSSNSAGFVTELGGLVGSNNQGAISDSYTTGTVTGPSSGGGNMGGLVGENYNGGSIANTFSTASVNGSLSIGGLVGANDSYNGMTSTISDSYSAGLVTGTAVGGFVGYASNGPSLVTDSFWDTETSGQSVGDGGGSSAGITGATSAQLISQTFITQNAPSFDFANVWTTYGGTTSAQLIGLPQAALPSAVGNILDGTAFLDGGVNAAGAGLSIDAISGGIVIGTTTTTSSGGFTFSLTSAQLTGGVLLTDATDNGNTYYQVNATSGNVTGLDIWGATLRVVGDTATFASLATAKGSLTNGINYTYNGSLFSTTAGVNLDILSDFGLNGVVAANDITIDHALTSNTPNLSVLTAYRNLIINNTVTNSGTGGITLQSDTIGTGVGTVTFNSGAQVSTSGPITIFYNPSVNPQGSAVNTTSYANPTENYAPDVAGGGTLTAYMWVNTLNDLQNVKNNLTGTYALSQNIDATPTASWNGGAGFVPIGHYDYSNSSDANTFSGTFNGEGHTINGLTINLPASVAGIGLFGDTAGTGVVENLNLTNANVIGETYVGALVGVDNATLTDVTSSGTVTGTNYVGGLVGISVATITQSSTAGTVTGNAGGSDVGGLIGFMQGGTTMNTFSTAAVSGYGSTGGLVGNNRGTIQLSYSTGAITAETGFNSVGGLVGYNSAGTIEDSYSTSPVTAVGTGQYLGGLAGFNAVTIDDSYATGAVTGFAGATLIGGFVGGNFATIHNAYSTGLVTGNGATNVGGFAGTSTTTIQNAFFDTDSSGQTFAIGNNSANTDVTAATTSQLETQSFITAHAATAPTFDFTNVWTTAGNTLTPQLVGLPQTALPTSFQLDTLDGTAFTDSSGLNFSAGVLIDLISGGSVIGSTTTSSAGTFTFNVSSTALVNGVLLTDATDKGNTFYETATPATTITGVDIWGSTVRVSADTATNAALGAATGSLPLTANGIAYSVAAGALTTTAGENFTILRNYTLDGNITASGVLTTNTAAILGGSANVTLTGASVAMAGTFNRTGALTVASTTGQILLNGVGTSSTPATATGLTLNSAQAILMNNNVLSLGSGGFTATGTGYTSTVDANGEANGINLFDTSITSSGNMSLTGTAGYTTNGNGGLSAGIGVAIGTSGNAAAVLDATGTANLTITGTFSQNIASTSLLSGVFLYKDITQSVNTVSVAAGRLTINGTVSQGTTTADAKGVGIEQGTVVQATGAGLVTINGINSATSATNLIGTDVAGGTVSVVDGTLNLNGTVTRGTAPGAIGVNLVTVASVASTGLGSVDVTGNSTGASASFNAGVYIDGATLASSGASGLAVNGNAGTVTGANPVSINGTSFNPTSAGILLTNGSSLSATNTGSVRLIGVAGPNDSTAPISAYGADTGVRFDPFASSQVLITSAGGGIAITGTSGSGAGTFFNVGVNVATATIQDTGDGAVTITGTGGPGQADNSGVAIQGATTSIQAGNGGGSSGVLTIIGHGGAGVAGSQNDGISIFNTAQLVSGGGGMVLTGDTATAGSGSSGVLISTASLTTPNGALAVNSNGGGLSIDATTTALTTSYSTPAGTSATLSNLNATTTLNGGNFFITQSGNLVLDTTTVQSLNLDVAGTITQVGTVSAGLLSISNATTVTLADPSNVIGSLGAVTTTGGFDFFSDPGLTLTNTVTSSGPITIAETGGPLTIASTGSVIETGTANIILAAGTNLATSNYFINNAGANAVDAGSGSFYLFTSDPTYDNFGGITFAPANLIYNAVYPTSANGVVGNAALFYVAGMGQVGPNSPNNNVPNTTTGGAAGAGSTIVPPVLVTQTSQILPPQPGDGSPGNPSNYLPNGGANSDGTQPPPFSFTGTGVSQLLGQLDGGLANSASNSGQVGSGDIAQLDNGQYSNVSNPQAADVLNEALGPIVYQNLADALKALGDWADVPDKANDTAAGEGETILTGGDVAEMTGTTAKKIPLSQAPEQLRNAMDDNTLKGAGH